MQKGPLVAGLFLNDGRFGLSALSRFRVFSWDGPLSVSAPLSNPNTFLVSGHPDLTYRYLSEVHRFVPRFPSRCLRIAPSISVRSRVHRPRHLERLGPLSAGRFKQVSLPERLAPQDPIYRLRSGPQIFHLKVLGQKFMPAIELEP